MILNEDGTATIYSSHGELTINSNSGKVIKLNLYGTNDHGLRDITKFDLEEEKKNGVGSNDILNFGYWFKSGNVDSGIDEILYEPPTFEWREEVLNLRKES